jgi:hypothetical protein
MNSATGFPLYCTVTLFDPEGVLCSGVRETGTRLDVVHLEEASTRE